MKYNLNVPDTPLFNVAKAKQMFDTDIKRTLNRMANKTVNNLMFTAPVGDTGALRNSIDSDLIGHTARVFVGVDYGVIIEKGRRPAPVSSSAMPGLINWIRRSTKGRAYYSALKSKYPRITPTGAAYALRKKLKKYGFKANPFFDRGIRRTEKVYRNETAMLLHLIKQGLMEK